jgi:HAD superfamily hydrolase (TIGR01484 family)
MIKLVAFDLDGTLAESKSAMDVEMAALINELLRVARVAVISGGDWPQFNTQFLAADLAPAGLGDLTLMPTCGTKCYTFEDGRWHQRYEEALSDEEVSAITEALATAMASLGEPPHQVWGEVVENRGSQITFSALGQQAPLAAKQAWDPDFSKRQAMKLDLDRLLPGCSVRLGGTTSIDVTGEGIDKAYAITKLSELLGIDQAEMLFVGDAVFPGGNDYPVKEAGVATIGVRDPDETKRVIEAIVACLGASRPSG